MEVLNKNQRRSAVWRLLSVIVLLLSLIGTGLYGMHNAYSGQGQDEVAQWKEKYEEEILEKEEEYQKLYNKWLAADRNFKKCIEDNSNDERVKELERDIKTLEKDILKVEKERDRYERKYDDCIMRNQ